MVASAQALPTPTTDLRWRTDPVLDVQHLTMRFGGLIAINDLSFQAGRGDITALIGPNGAGKTTVFNCITGFYKPTEGMITLRQRGGSEFLLERLPGHSINWKAKVARTFQNIRLFSGMTVLENLLVAQHNPLMIASGFTFLGVLGVGGYGEAERQAIEKASYWLERTRLVERADDPAGEQRPQPAPQIHPRRARHLDLPHRARHVGRNGDLGPRRGARLRHQDLG